MKKGANLSFVQDENPNFLDYHYFHLLNGDQRVTGCMDIWNNALSTKRGIIHEVFLTSDPRSVANNASKLVELVGEIGEGNLHLPIIIDKFSDLGDNFQFDQLYEYVRYLDEYLGLKHKPLIRIVPGNWNEWYAKNQGLAMKLLDHADLLVANWNLARPEELAGIGRQAWFEYKLWKIAHDETCQWVEGVIQEPVEPPVTPPEEPTPEPVLLEAKPVAYEVDCEVKLGIFRGHLKGTLTPIVEESEGE